MNTGKAGEDAVADPAEVAEVEGKRRFLEGLIAIYELGSRGGDRPQATARSAR